MLEDNVQEHRIRKLEEDVKTLYAKVNTFAVSSAELNTKLNSVLLTLGELKESINAVQQRPNRLWDKFLFAILTALGTGVGTAILVYLK